MHYEVMHKEVDSIRTKGAMQSKATLYEGVLYRYESI